jgi:hypothetical protein
MIIKNNEHILLKFLNFIVCDSNLIVEVLQAHTFTNNSTQLINKIFKKFDKMKIIEFMPKLLKYPR